MAKKDKDELLALLVRGQLKSREAKEARRVLEADPVYRDLLSGLTDGRDQRTNDYWRQLRSATHSLVDEILKQLDQQAGKEETRGLLTYDSSLMPLPEGVRPAAVDSRRLRWACGPFRVELACHPVSTSRWELIGRLEGWDCKRPPVIILDTGKQRFTAKADEFSVFRFNRVPSSEYELIVTSGDDKLGSMALSI